MSKRKQLVEKIIREELVGYAKKILDEGMRTPYMNLPDAPPDRAIAPNKKRSTVTSIVDEPDLKHHYVEEKFSDRLEEEASESDREEFGVNTTSALPAGGDETGKIEHVPGYPLESDKALQTESVFRRWKKLALITEGVDDAEFEAEELAPPVYVDPETGMEAEPPTEAPEVPGPAPTSPQPAPAPDTGGRIEDLGQDLEGVQAGVETDMADIAAPGGGNLMDMSRDLFGGEFTPGGEMFDLGDLGMPPLDMGPDSPTEVEADIEGQVEQDFEMPEAEETLKEAIRRVLREKLLT